MQYKVSVIKCPLFTGVGGPVLGSHVGHDPGPEPGDEPGDQVGEVVVEVEQREVRPGAGPAGLQPPGHGHQYQPRPPGELFNFYIQYTLKYLEKASNAATIMVLQTSIPNQVERLS